jgi:hypothetical protein
MTDIFNLEIDLNVPAIYNNTHSRGYILYELHHITGLMKITYTEDIYSPVIELTDLYNHSYKVGGSNLRYTAYLDNGEAYGISTRFSYIGYNETDLFPYPNIQFFATLEPSYNIGEWDEPDNSLLCIFAGSGTSKYNSNGKLKVYQLMGTVSGAMGCGCTAYGHLSPTRLAGPDGAILDKFDESNNSFEIENYKGVTDVAASWGTWKATLMDTNN